MAWGTVDPCPEVGWNQTPPFANVPLPPPPPPPPLLAQDPPRIELRVAPSTSASCCPSPSKAGFPKPHTDRRIEDPGGIHGHLRGYLASLAAGL